MGGRRSGVGHSVAKRVEPEMDERSCNGCESGMSNAEEVPVNTKPPAQQRPGATPCGQQQGLLCPLWPSVWPAQDVGMFCVAAALA